MTDTDNPNLPPAQIGKPWDDGFDTHQPRIDRIDVGNTHFVAHLVTSGDPPRVQVGQYTVDGIVWKDATWTDAPTAAADPVEKLRALHETWCPNRVNASLGPDACRCLQEPLRPDILTQSGHYFDYLHPQGNEFSIEDIAHGLANTCRFTGQSREFYSVAQHSVHVSRLVPLWVAVYGLLHDAAEAFMCDIPRPLKRLLPDYRAIEQRVEEVVLARFGLGLNKPAEVKYADRVALATEQRDLMPPHDDPWWLIEGVQPDPEPIRAMLPADAKRLFLDRWHQLGGKP